MWMFERYTDQARRVIFFARYEASQYGSPYVETEHLLLGLSRECRPAVSRWFPGRTNIAKKSVPKSRVGLFVASGYRSQSRRLFQKNVRTPYDWPPIPAKHSAIGTLNPEHLLLGILRVEASLAAQVLIGLELKAGTSYEQLTRARNQPSQPSPDAQAALHRFLAGLKSPSGELIEFFSANGEFVDAAGKKVECRRNRKEFRGLICSLREEKCHVRCRRDLSGDASFRSPITRDQVVIGSLRKTEKPTLFGVKRCQSPVGNNAVQADQLRSQDYPNKCRTAPSGGWGRPG